MNLRLTGIVVGALAACPLIAAAAPSAAKRAAVSSVERACAGTHRHVRSDLGLRRNRAARTPVLEAAGGLRGGARICGDARRVRHAHGLHRPLRNWPARGRHHGRVRRAARRLAEGDRREEPAGRGRRRPRLRSQPVRRRKPRRGARDQGADRGRQTQGHHHFFRHAGRGVRGRQDLHGARRRVQRRRCHARLAPER